MAIEVDICGLPCFIAFFLLFIAILVYAFWQKRQRKSLISKLKKEKPFEYNEGAPIVIEGDAIGPELNLPSTGEKVAFYSIAIISKKISSKSGIAGSEFKGFRINELSGDLTISAKEGKDYEVKISKYLEGIRKGMGMTVVPFVKTAVNLKLGSLPNKEEFVEMALESKAVENVMMLVFKSNFYEQESGSETSLPFYTSSTKSIKIDEVKTTVDTKVEEFVIGKDAPPEVMEILEKKHIMGNFAGYGDEIYVIETYIPLGKRVFAAGSYSKEEGKDAVMFKSSVMNLTVSYEDPEYI